MNNTLYIVGAYGRDYSTKESLLLEWYLGKDFKVKDGPYFSKRDTPNLKEAGYTELMYLSTKTEFTHIIKL